MKKVFISEYTLTEEQGYHIDNNISELLTSFIFSKNSCVLWIHYN